MFKYGKNVKILCVTKIAIMELELWQKIMALIRFKCMYSMHELGEAIELLENIILYRTCNWCKICYRSDRYVRDERKMRG